jgi:hypothetical protein
LRAVVGVRVAMLVLVAAGLIAAGCGGDDEGGESGEDTTSVAVPGEEAAAALYEEIADLSDEQQIERVGEAWADPFGKADEAMCAYLHPDLAPEACVEAAYLEGALTNGSRLQSTFAGTTVKSVEVRGDTAIAEFSNGHGVKFMTDPDGDWKVLEPAQAPVSQSEPVIQPQF